MLPRFSGHKRARSTCHQSPSSTALFQENQSVIDIGMETTSWQSWCRRIRVQRRCSRKEAEELEVQVLSLSVSELSRHAEQEWTLSSMKWASGFSKKFQGKGGLAKWKIVLEY